MLLAMDTFNIQQDRAWIGQKKYKSLIEAFKNETKVCTKKKIQVLEKNGNKLVQENSHQPKVRLHEPKKPKNEKGFK